MFAEQLRKRISSYFVNVPRVEMLSGVELISVTDSDKLLKPSGLKIANQTLVEDLCLLALGSEVKNRFDVEASIAYELSKRMPWYLRLIPSLEKFARARFTRAHMRDWFMLEMLQTLKLPGINHKARYISAAVLYFATKAAVQNMDMSLADVKEWLAKVTSLSQRISEEEEILLEALPGDETMAELPEMLAKQFEKDGVDNELFFAGEQYGPAYAVAKAVRNLKFAREDRFPKNAKHFQLLEQLISHPGRAIILHTSRQLEHFQAFVLEKLKEFHVDYGGDEMRHRPIADTSEIRLARTGSLAMAGVHPLLFWRRVVNREIDVREYGFIEEERPRAHLLIDKSPSMLFFGRLFKAGGVLFNRLLKSLDDSADVSFQLFDEKVHKRIDVHGPYEAQQVMTMIRMANFVGSGTDIDNVLRTTLARVRKLPEKKTRDHVILVSDGKADVTVTKEECEFIKLHCFILGEVGNAELRTICHATGGVYQEC